MGVQSAWLIPVFPMAAFLLIVFVWRPLDLRDRRKVELTPVIATAIHGTVGAHEARTRDAPVALVAKEHETGGHGHVGHAAHAPNTRFGWASSITGVIAMLASFVVALAVFFQFLTNPDLLRRGYQVFSWNWLTLNINHPAAAGSSYAIGFHIDPLTSVMLLVVTSVSLLVHFYSQGYMQGDPGYPRFFAWLALFTVSMLLLVLADNFLLLYIGWELVGLCSYLLIGFWYERNDPPPAALKAFVTTRFGDFGLLIGILILFASTGTFSFALLPAAVHFMNPTLLTVTMILVFCGAVGKSAQFPLHVWLPDAMEGPTPVSALIHAATMVAAGVYLVARTFLLFRAADPTAFLVVAYIGGFTAIFAATIALVQNDIKRVLAYSTISQLGYMFVGLGVADTQAPGIFHLFTHAFFKALLFLGSGSVIHAMHAAENAEDQAQDMRYMGGLAPRMKVTASCFLMATLSISGFPGFAGFFSKDDIIGQTFDHGQYILYALTLVTAGLTAFYMFRLWFMTFGGRGGRFFGFWGGGYRGVGNPPESSWLITLPLVLLAIPSVLAGYWAWNGAFATFLLGGAQQPFVNPFYVGLTYVGVGTAFVGIALAWAMYGAGWRWDLAFTRTPVGAFLYRVLLNKYYLDELYLWIIRQGVLGLSYAEAAFDRYVIDGLVNGTASVIAGLGADFRRVETGRLQNYAVAIFGGAIFLSAAVFIFVQAVK
jgi:NADH-quinone oxidoreductase subunit L